MTPKKALRSFSSPTQRTSREQRRCWVRWTRAVTVSPTLGTSGADARLATDATGAAYRAGRLRRETAASGRGQQGGSWDVRCGPLVRRTLLPAPYARCCQHPTRRWCERQQGDRVSDSHFESYAIARTLASRRNIQAVCMKVAHSYSTLGRLRTCSGAAVSVSGPYLEASTASPSTKVPSPL